MVLRKVSVTEYRELGDLLKELKQKNEAVRIALSKVCGNSYAERNLMNVMDFNNISFTLENKMNKDYPGSKAEAMKVFF